MHKLILFLVCSVFLFSCRKETFDIANLNNNKISAIGHGGMGFGHIYPINSFESVAYSLNIGADGVEVDIEMTKDSVFVLFHDEEMSHKTNGSGTIYEKNWSDVRKLTYTDPLYTQYKVVDLDILFSGIKNKHKKIFFLDCKNYSPDNSAAYYNRFCTTLLAYIDKYGIQNNVIVELKKESLIKHLNDLRPDLRIIVYEDYESAVEIAEKYQLYGIITSLDKITKDQVR